MKKLILTLMIALASTSSFCQDSYFMRKYVCDSIANEDDFNYYKQKYLQARNTRNVGIGFTTVGLVFFGIGAVSLGTDYTNPIGSILFITGSALTVIGIPVLATGSIRMGRFKRLMKELTAKASIRMGPTRLYFGPAGKGVGLTLKF